MQDKNNNINKVLVHYLVNKLTDEESRVLQNWINESAQNQEIINRLHKIWSMQSAEFHYHDEDQLARQLWQKAHGSNSNDAQRYRFNFGFLYRVAAILLITVSVVFIFDQVGIKPGSKQEDQVLTISKLNPAGQKSQIMLPDGTKVWLNADSKLTFPERFSDTLRFVELSGEAFFDVVKDKSRDFTVISGNVTTTALGTSFNVLAYEPENIQISLVTGAVKVQSERSTDSDVILNEGMAVDYDLKKGLSEAYTFNIDRRLAWKEGTLIFEDDTFESFIQKIKRWYGVEVTIVGQPQDTWDLNGEFNNIYLKKILDNVSYAKDFKYELNDKDLKIWFN